MGLRFGFITDEDYKTAERNGIKKKTAIARVNDYGWDIDKAVNHPVIKGSVSLVWDEWKVTAESNGISRSTFRQRMKYHGFNAMEAATIPLLKSNRADRWTQEEKNTIIANGLTINLANTRIHTLGWDKEKAMSHPRMTQKERGERIKAGIAKKKAEGTYRANKGILNQRDGSI